MPLPTAVRKRSEQARALAAQLKRPREEVELETELVIDARSVPVETPPDPAPDLRPPPPEVVDPSEPVVVESTGPIDLDDWEGRYRQLRTARDQRVARLETENAELRGQLQQLQSQVGQGAPETQQSAQPFELNPDEREYLGDQEAQVLERLAATNNQRFDQLERDRNAEAERADRRFYADLGSLVPEWETVNVDPGFNRWLDQVDPETHAVRRETLNLAAAERDARSAASLFRQ